MKITRRDFLKGSAAGGALVASRFLYGELETLVAAPPGTAAAPTEKWVPTTCWIGKQDCGILARRINGRVVAFQGHPAHPRNRGTLCPKGVAQIMALYDPNRVKVPLIRTNEKGVPGKWRQASWDEALTLVGNKIKEVRAKDKRLLVWQKGRSKAKHFYDDAFVKASGATKLGHGAYCSDAGYRACEYTIGPHGVLHPDFRHTRYLLAWGWNITNAGGNKLCWITWPQQLITAKERGMKVVAIDPRLLGAGPFADEWLPIRPATDLAFALALCNVLIEQGTIDRDYLKKYANAPFLVKKDGCFLRVDGKEQVWNVKSSSARPYDAKDVDPALEGDFTVGGVKVRPAFQVFKEHEEIYWQDYTPLPTWRTPTMDGSPPEYDLYLISYKLIEFKQSRASQIPLLAELAPKQWLEINPKTAKAKGINDGDEVCVESHNAVTGETRKVKVTARYRESIRPDTVGMPHHYGEVARHPWTQGQGPMPNVLYFTGEGYVTNTNDQSFHVKVRVYKA